MKHWRRRSAPLFVLVAIILLAFALRLFRLDATPLRGDEAFAIEYWAAPWPEALALSGREPHPLGTFALFALWRGIFGDGEWVMRLLPGLFSLPGVAATYLLGRLLFRQGRAALLGALLYAVHPFLIWHAQDVRNYAIWAASSPVAMAAFLLAVRRHRRVDWARYILTTAFSAYIFFFEPFFVVAQGVYLFLSRSERWRSWLLSLLVVAALLIPWSAQLVALSGSDYGGTTQPFDPAHLLTGFLPVLILGQTLPEPLLRLAWIVLLPLLVGALVLLWRWQRRAALFLAVGLVVPVLILAVLSVRVSVFDARYVIAVEVYLVLLVAGFWGYLTTRKKRAGMLAFLLPAALLALNCWALVNHYANPAYRKAPDWRTLGAFLTSHTRPDDLVVQQALDPAFTYYYRGPADETTLPLHADAPAKETIGILRQELDARRAVWLIPADLPWYDPEHVPLNWLLDHAQLTLETQVAESRVLEFRSWNVRPQDYTPRLDTTFDNLVTLLDWQVDRPATDLLRVILYWQPRRRTTEALDGFVHLIGPPHPETGSPIWTQDDHRVPGPSGPTDSTRWEAGVVWRDVYLLRLPTNLPEHPWTLHVGLYTPSTMARLTSDGSDHVEIPLGPGLLPAQSVPSSEP